LWVEGAFRVLRTAFAPTRVEGRDHVEGVRGPVVFAANHESHADTMTVLLALPAARRRRTIVAAAADYWFAGRVRGAFARTCVGAIPVQRDRVNRRTLDECHRLLSEGWSLLVYPEGGRSPAGTIREFQPGAAWIARRAGVPVVPVFLSGTAAVLAKGQTMPRRSRVRVVFGRPLVRDDKESARAFGRRIEAAVRDLSTG
jgi:1-acyl-sn-glycerol-3-phosphate acyltransferase